jgi:hypothetical protein
LALSASSGRWLKFSVGSLAREFEPLPALSSRASPPVKRLLQSGYFSVLEVLGGLEVDGSSLGTDALCETR